jgi:hypothetical protein
VVNGGDDNLVGDAGNDKVIGGPGKDTETLGDDSAQVTRNPGDGEDHVDGDAGKATLLFNGSDASEGVEAIGTNGPRTSSVGMKALARPWRLISVASSW